MHRVVVMANSHREFHRGRRAVHRLVVRLDLQSRLISEVFELKDTGLPDVLMLRVPTGSAIDAKSTL